MPNKSPEVHMSKDAQEAIEILEWIRDNAGVEEFSNYGLAYGFIKSNGYVNQIFFSQIKDRKKELERSLK